MCKQDFNVSPFFLLVSTELVHQSAAYSMQLESLQHPESRFLVSIPLQQTPNLSHSLSLSFF